MKHLKNGSFAAAKVIPVKYEEELEDFVVEVRRWLCARLYCVPQSRSRLPRPGLLNSRLKPACYEQVEKTLGFTTFPRKHNRAKPLIVS